MPFKKSSQLFVLCVLILSACMGKRADKTMPVFEKAGPGDSLAFYFPVVLNDTSARRDEYFRNFKQKWYSTTLYSFKEPILFRKTDMETIYRFLWLRSFHRPVCFTIRKSGAHYFLNGKMLDRQPSFYPVVIERNDENGKAMIDTLERGERLAFIEKDTVVELSTVSFDKIEKYLAAFDFWNSAFVVEDGNTDGANWILEGRKNGRYHFTDTRRPNKEFEELCRYLIKLSGLEIKEDEIY